MTGTESDSARTATLRTTHVDAALVAAALAPDDTESMATRVDGDAIACEIERGTTGGLQSTVDDYVVNLHVADRIAERARAHRAARGPDANTADSANAADAEDGANAVDTADTTDTNT
ncbi:KEOPS complex Pcc1-like subunit [Halorubrum sp. SD626R]|uniref:KEOPS complex subunit Pcc1 n=1 Tax=Halorubrum TaxID=56688 RepID=UPI0010F6997B|nr:MULTISPECIES: KEOPS complex subunit Pcc1 [Halorubrum]TKX78775.1 KEOPS complex Pcc1-like subunit [Halorubrum sp. SD626R]